MENTKNKNRRNPAEFGDEKQFLGMEIDEKFGTISGDEDQKTSKKYLYEGEENFAKNSKYCKKIDKNVQNLPKSEVKNNKLQILKNLTLEDWVVLVFEVSPYISSMYEFVDGLFDRLAFSNYSGTRRRGGCLSLFDEVIDIMERKKQLVNLSVVATRLLSIADEEETDVLEATLTRKKTISDIASRGNYRWVYRAREKFVKRVAETCRVSGWNEDFFMSHFASEPLVQYYAFGRESE